MKVIGITGRRLSGKSTAAGHISRRHGFRILEFTDHVLAPLLREQGKPVTRENLIGLAMSIRAERGTDALVKMLAGGIKEGNCMIVGIRFPEEVSYLRGRFGKRFVLVSVECDSRIRYRRVARRGVKEDSRMTYGEFMEKERLPTERPIPDAMRLADFSLTNEGTRSGLYRQIDGMMGKIKFNK
jgi:dephospho-CoA kinase